MGYSGNGGSAVVHHDLDQLAGTWDKKDVTEFRKNVEDFEKIYEKMW